MALPSPMGEHDSLPAAMSGYTWYAVHTKPFCEAQAAASLAALRYVRVYRPELRRQQGGTYERTPLFPRYLFVYSDLQAQGATPINCAIGVSRLVTFDDTPCPIPSEIIEALHERVTIINRCAGLIERGYSSGQQAVLRGGPLGSLALAFHDPLPPSVRVRVLIAFLGQLREAEVGLAGIEPACEPAQRRARGTRGGGRRIVSGS